MIQQTSRLGQGGVVKGLASTAMIQQSSKVEQGGVQGFSKYSTAMIQQSSKYSVLCDLVTLKTSDIGCNIAVSLCMNVHTVIFGLSI